MISLILYWFVLTAVMLRLGSLCFRYEKAGDMRRASRMLWIGVAVYALHWTVPITLATSGVRFP